MLVRRRAIALIETQLETQREREREESVASRLSKRRAGLFKKASELSILCGAEVAAVVFSPAGKAFSFGHPTVEAILDRFVSTGGAVTGRGGRAGASREDSKQLLDLNRECEELKARLDATKVRKEGVEAYMAKERVAASPVAAWLDADVRDMGEDELMEFAAALQGVQAAVAARANQVLQDALNHGREMAARNSSRMVPLPAPQQHQLLGMGVGDNDGESGQFGAGGNSNNGSGMDMQIQQMMMAMPPPTPAATGMEMMLLQQGFVLPGLY